MAAMLTGQALAVEIKETLLSLHQDPPTIVNGTYDSYVFFT